LRNVAACGDTGSMAGGVILVGLTLLWIFFGQPHISWWWRLYMVLIIIGFVCVADLHAGMTLLSWYAKGTYGLMHGVGTAINQGSQ